MPVSLTRRYGWHKLSANRSFELANSDAQRWLRRYLTWSTLSTFGNSPVARVVAFAPIIAVYVKLQEEFLSLHFGLSQAQWLYWSLMLIAAGQVLYFFFCPRIIKKYGGDVERHAIETLESTPYQKMDLIREKRIRNLYQNHQLSLGIDPDDIAFPSHLEKAMAGIAPTQEMLSRFAYAYRKLWEVAHTRATDVRVGLNLITLAQMFSANSTFLMGAGQGSGAAKAQRVLRDLLVEGESGDADWQLNAAHWAYAHANERFRPIIMLVAALYVSGSVYFAWRVLDGLAFMLCHLRPGLCAASALPT